MAPAPDENREKPNTDTSSSGIDSLDVPDVVINAGSSESEDEEVTTGYMGYEPLPQDFNQEDSDGDDEDDESGNEGPAQDPRLSESGEEAQTSTATGGVNEGILHQIRQQDFPSGSNLPNYMKVPALPRPDKKELLWNQPRPAALPKMDAGQAEKIRNAMSGFKLPSTNIPDWAKSLTDDEWKRNVVGKLLGESGNTSDQRSVSNRTNPGEASTSAVVKGCSVAGIDSAERRSENSDTSKLERDDCSANTCESSVK